MSRHYLFLSAIPAAFSLILYYSLAIHMYLTLGDWPVGIGEGGFPEELVVHANVQRYYFVGLLLFSITVLPVAALAFCFVPRLRSLSLYCFTASAMVFFSFALMQIAPAEFLYWWWD